MPEPLIRLEHITRTYRVGDVDVHALRDVSLTINAGEFVAIVGASGSGKSTLMAVLGCLDRPTGGRYFFEGVDVAGLSEPERAQLRSERLGFVFQSFNLLARTSALENVALPTILLGRRSGERRLARRSRACLAQAPGPERPRAQHARTIVRRSAATGGHRARADQRARVAAGRRTDRQSRHPHLARDHGDADQAQPRAGRHRHRGHARGRHRRLCRSHIDHARRRGRRRYAQSEADAACAKRPRGEPAPPHPREAAGPAAARVSLGASG